MGVNAPNPPNATAPHHMWQDLKDLDFDQPGLGSYPVRMSALIAQALLIPPWRKLTDIVDKPTVSGKIGAVVKLPLSLIDSGGQLIGVVGTQAFALPGAVIEAMGSPKTIVDGLSEQSLAAKSEASKRMMGLATIAALKGLKEAANLVQVVIDAGWTAAMNSSALREIIDTANAIISQIPQP